MTTFDAPEELSCFLTRKQDRGIPSPGTLRSLAKRARDSFDLDAATKATMMAGDH
jgi:hypothetical protein